MRKRKRQGEIEKEGQKGRDREGETKRERKRKRERQGDREERERGNTERQRERQRGRDGGDSEGKGQSTERYINSEMCVNTHVCAGGAWMSSGCPLNTRGHRPSQRGPRAPHYFHSNTKVSFAGITVVADVQMQQKIKPRCPDPVRTLAPVTVSFPPSAHVGNYGPASCENNLSKLTKPRILSTPTLRHASWGPWPVRREPEPHTQARVGGGGEPVQCWELDWMLVPGKPL